jgi:hypothetical protein
MHVPRADWTIVAQRPENDSPTDVGENSAALVAAGIGLLSSAASSLTVNDTVMRHWRHPVG